jgi:hypothetical protein
MSTERIEELLEKPYWIIDILPEQVPADSAGQYFAVEEYFRRQPETKQKKINVILKINCYEDVFLCEDEVMNPEPDRIDEIIRNDYCNFLVRDALITSDPEDTYMTVFDPDEELLYLIREIAVSEGLYVWQPEE